MPLPYDSKNRVHAWELRSRPTEAEQLLWSRLRRKQILGLQLYRQKPIGPYIVDFYCPKAKLVIEADGGQHWQPEEKEADRLRDQALAELGLETLRFSNREIFRQMDAVLEKIYAAVESRLEK